MARHTDPANRHTNGQSHRPAGLATRVCVTAGVLLALAACADQNVEGSAAENGGTVTLSGLDGALQTLISEQQLEGDPTAGRALPSITDPLPQLGKDLFFSKALGGGFDAACVSCHHPALGGADNLSLSVGVGAINPDLLGLGREHTDGLPLVPRNAPTVFNLGLWDTSLFWDSRVESLAKTAGTNGADAGIRTPDTLLGTADPDAGPNLATALAHFPVTSDVEMRTDAFEPGAGNEAVRDHLAARLGNYGVGAGELATNTWLPAFRAAFNSTASAENLITFDNIALALGEYQRSMVFVDTPWNRYLNGDTTAMTDTEKAGALLFFDTGGRNGANCVDCHSGALFSDGTHETIGFPQIGPGKGDGTTANDDFGRERETGLVADRYRYRVPSLLNVDMTAPYGHSGAYATLDEVLDHYDNPDRTVNRFFNRGGWCDLDQFEGTANCGNLYPDAEDNSALALAKLDSDQNSGASRFGNFNLSNTEKDQLVAFLQALTDPCTEDRSCLDPWIANPASSGNDGLQLNAVDRNLNPL